MDATSPHTTYYLAFFDLGYVVVDGLKFQNGSGVCGGTTTGSVPLINKDLLRNIEVNGAGCGSGNGGIQLFDGLSYLTIEYYVGHDDGNQHGLYMGSRGIASDHVTIRRSLFYQNNWSGMHWNGRCTACLIEQNISYSNGISGISIQEGFKNSFVTANLSFNNLSQALEMSNYDGDGMTILPYDQTGNLFENNTFYSTGKDWMGNDGSGNPTGIQIGYQGACTSMTCLATSFASNVFRNNIIAPWGNHNLVPAIIFQDNDAIAGACGTACQAWVHSGTFEGTQGYQTDGFAGTGMFKFGSVLSCPSAISAGYPVTGLCNVSTTNFVAASPSYYNSTNSFNFHLGSGSPAIHTGTNTTLPIFDWSGITFLTIPSIGSLESVAFVTPPPISGSALGGDLSLSGFAIK